MGSLKTAAGDQGEVPLDHAAAPETGFILNTSGQGGWKLDIASVCDENKR